jgi:hypothetical protein
MVQDDEYGEILCTHVCQWKNDICSNRSMNGGGDSEEEWWKG